MAGRTSYRSTRPSTRTQKVTSSEAPRSSFGGVSKGKARSRSSGAAPYRPRPHPDRCPDRSPVLHPGPVHLRPPPPPPLPSPLPGPRCRRRRAAGPPRRSAGDGCRIRCGCAERPPRRPRPAGWTTPQRSFTGGGGAGAAWPSAARLGRRRQGNIRHAVASATAAAHPERGTAMALPAPASRCQSRSPWKHDSASSAAWSASESAQAEVPSAPGRQRQMRQGDGGRLGARVGTSGYFASWAAKDNGSALPETPPPGPERTRGGPRAPARRVLHGTGQRPGLYLLAIRLLGGESDDLDPAPREPRPSPRPRPDRAGSLPP